MRPSEAARIRVQGDRDAAILLPLYLSDEAVHVVFTRRRSDLRLHPGQISFPGGSPDPGEDLQAAALRESWEEIGLAADAVDVVGALAPQSTFVSGFRVHCFVGVLEGPRRWLPSEAEVAAVLEPTVAELHAGFARRTVQTPRGPISHGTYLVGEDLIWGATARIVGALLSALGEYG